MRNLIPCLILGLVFVVGCGDSPAPSSSKGPAVKKDPVGEDGFREVTRPKMPPIPKVAPPANKDS